MSLIDYKITEKICENSNVILFRARPRHEEDRSVLLKILRGNEPQPEKTAWFCQEYGLLEQLTTPAAISTEKLTWNAHQPVMILEDIGGQTLTNLNYRGNLSPQGFLELALALARMIEQIHQAKIFHKDINPSNLLLNPVTNNIQLIDFAIATQMPATTSPALSTPEILGDNLAYISPEQTGRTNHQIDYRTDFYSLGILLYELLTGQLPFESNDPLEIIHYHIARQAVAPTEIATFNEGSQIPAQISAIVLKLINKDPQNRYQSAQGLIADLERCEYEFNTDREISHFTLGMVDYKPELQLSSTLFGRQNVQQRLITALDATTANHASASKLWLVSGEAGVGKSALVYTLKPHILNQQGLFISGKYDQYQRNVPYSGFTQALNQFCDQILSSSKTELIQWKDRLIKVIGANYYLLCSIAPKFELIFGPQSTRSSQQIQATDNSNRLHLALEKLLTEISEVYRPLVIFLDDLQWADAASLRLIHHLIQDSQFEHLVLIGAYRPAEVSSIAPLAITLNELRKAQQTIEIDLHPLTVNDVNQLLTATFDCNVQRSQPLAELIHRKTNGNPFFILEFLKSIYAEQLLEYKPGQIGTTAAEEITSQAQWTWDINGILAKDITPNVIDLMLDRIQELPDATNRIIQVAACLGNQFNLADLGAINDTAPCTALHTLWPAIESGLVTPLNEQYRLYLNTSLFTRLNNNPEPAASAEDSQLTARLAEQHQFLLETAKLVTFKFQHDRVHEAAYQAMPPSEQMQLHHQIGHILLAQYSGVERDAHILDIVNHLNQGQSCLTTNEARYQLAELNLEAGQKAAHSAAHKTAGTYFQQGIELCQADAWVTHYELMLAFYDAANVAACLTGDFEQQQQICQTIEQHARTWADRVAMTEIAMQACIAQRQFTNAVDTALEFLQQLDICFPASPQPEDFQSELVKTLTALAGKSPLTLLDLPAMKSAEAATVLRLLHQIHTALYMSKPTLFPLAIFKEVQLSLEHGNSQLSAPAYVYFGLILCGIIGDIDNGYEFGQLAKQLVDQSETKMTRSATFLTMAGATVHWREHISNTLPIFQDGYHSGVETGDFQSAAFCLELYCSHSFLMGMPLVELAETANYSVQVIGQLHQASPLLFTQIYQQIIINQIDSEHSTPWEITGEVCEEAPLIAELKQISNFSTLGHIYVNKLMLCYWFGEYEQAETLIEATAPYLQALTGTIMVPLYHFYAAMTLLAQYVSKSDADKVAILEALPSHQEKLETWSKFAPMNYTHKWALIEAERLRVNDQPWEAMQFYEQAIQGARQHGYLNEEVIACEQLSVLYQTYHYTDQANYYIRQAHFVCDRWQNAAKLRQLERKYSDYLPTGLTHEQLSISTQLGEQRLDFASILKASQVVSSEIELISLLSRLMTIVLENAGAEAGKLILMHQGETAIFAEGSIDRDVQVSVAQPVQLTSENVPRQIINYVMRLRKSVILENACKIGEFTDDTYIQTHQTKSLLCVPLLNQQKLTGVLYVENNLTPGAFTEQRSEVLTILCAQAAISIENAQLYDQLKRHSFDLERKVAERTYELRAVNHELQRLAMLDGLTKIANRRRFDEYLHQEYWRTQRDQSDLSIILCDVDHFKLFNDHYGHQAGDECLKQVAQVLSRSTKRSVDLVARYGGEEFALILPSTNIEGAAAIAEEIRQNLEAMQMPHEASLTHRYVTMSLGISCNQLNLELKQPQDLVEYADQALYEAKSSGRNRYAVTQVPASENSTDEQVRHDQLTDSKASGSDTSKP